MSFACAIALCHINQVKAYANADNNLMKKTNNTKYFTWKHKDMNYDIKTKAKDSNKRQKIDNQCSANCGFNSSAC